MILSIIIPAKNEAESIPSLIKEIIEVVGRIEFEILVIDDGSEDETRTLLQCLNKENPRVKCISFSRNFGKSSAEMCGLKYASGQMTIIMDADHQHPPYLITKMMQKHEEGFDVVIGQRKEYKTSWIRRFTSDQFKKIISKMSDYDMDFGGSEYILFGEKAKNAVLSLPEYNRFNRGLFQWIGFKSFFLYYNAQERRSGRSKFNIKGLLKLSINGLTSFSGKPLRIPLYTGLVFGFLAFIYATYSIIKFLGGETVPGWTSLIITNLVIGSIILLQLGIIGEYLYRTFQETKNRPLYIVDEKIGFHEEK